MTQRLKLDGDTFDAWRERPGGARLAVFVAAWCEPCESLLATLATSGDGLPLDQPVGVVDVDREPVLAERYGVRGTPTLTLFVNGEARTSRVGALSRSQLAQLCDEAARS
ncbi:MULTISPECIES: thioredoxin domain-containing protein [Salinicola]|nr:MULTISPECIES: thioredoxin domain-containing protein [Salinicola]